jgi:hypothetical protein
MLATVLKRQSADLELTEEEILAAANRIPRLHMLLDSYTPLTAYSDAAARSSSATISGDPAGHTLTSGA